MYTALYRRFRPSNFDEVVGQDAIVRALRNQVKHNMISHAYLFTGSRGTGKTSMAKIFAKAVNCMEPVDGNPCGHCRNCQSMANGDSLDMIEIDAASNNGVNNIRELREDVKYPPSTGKYRVYIIDEVHMLSQGAFNALLKTLEEPPSYIIFILATTDPQKVPVTISSRCQRYDFKRIPVNSIVNKLMDIARSVGIDLKADAAMLIARKAEGAMRDALSILDECISFSGKTITRENVLDALGITGEDSLIELLTSLEQKDSSRCIDVIDREYMNGKDPAQITRDLLGLLRDLLFMKTVNNSKAKLDLPDSEYESLTQLASSMDTKEIVKIIDALSATEHYLRYSAQPLIVLETALIKLCMAMDEKTEAEGVTTPVPQRASAAKSKEAGVKQESRALKQGSVPKVEREDVLENKADLGDNDSNKTYNAVKEAWPHILSAVKQKSMVLYAYLSEGVLSEKSNETIRLVYKSDGAFFREEMEKPENKEIVENTIKEITGLNAKIECIIEEENQEEDEFLTKVYKVFDGVEIKVMKE
ncbi:DNA polymerase III subunit gamma/tau [Calorimonas adulescens]|uniref:DNA-directed DNA polymerase n=1 Tax=Calorimonas adulescens TaxID=2606906 RepID=A0A5D8Q941_9THEO|nr:DNA polymerase III subunit gamma/tau [Calorimonas adulescens]TZE80629.1 DNA polymerase III subunit gamma/tau [Calorimonas adulescens]